MPRTPSSSKNARLDATVLDRMLVRPGWARTVLLRRCAAGMLAVVGIVVFARDAVAEDHVAIVVAARDLKPGIQLEVGDVELRDFVPSTVPDGAVHDVDDVLAHTVAGPVGAGEPLTDLRLLSSRLTETTIDVPDARIVPVRLSDAGVTDLLRSGDTVDVLTVGEGDDDRTARVLSTRSVVVLVSAEGSGTRGQDSVVLVAMSAEDATIVAAASLVGALTVTLH